MVIRNINLETVCGITSVLPENDRPEIAFAGKSGVSRNTFSSCVLQIYSLGESHTKRSLACSSIHLKAMKLLPVPVGWMTAALPAEASIAITASYA